MERVECILSGNEENPAPLIVHDSRSPGSDGSIMVSCRSGAEVQAPSTFSGLGGVTVYRRLNVPLG